MRLIVICLFFISTSAVIAQEKSILFIGNSYTAAYHLPALVDSLAVANEHTVFIDSHNPGGTRFEQHKTNPTALDKIASRNWDYIVLQDQSQIPALPIEIVGAMNSPENAADLNDIIKDNYACTEVVFYMTWGRKTGDADFCPDYPPVCTYEGMQDELSSAYVLMANENDATVAPAGEAWRAVINDDPDIELYSGDGSHPNINGTYLTACVMYATMFQSPSLGTTYTAGIDAELAAYFQTKADEVVFGTPEVWRIGANDLLANFNYEETSPLTYSFSSEDEAATAWEWNIDGTVYLTENPIHTFPAINEYTVELTTNNDCDTSTRSLIMNLAADAGIENNETTFSIYPNPNNGIFKIDGVYAGEDLRIIDLTGKIVFEEQLKNTIETINISFLPAGIYFLAINHSKQKISIR
ncbi:T9SS type A sorting domain-containing protein [Crocinitomix catalasitica]|uniref:T9SS type A sorting domain-containing protein n=1 Tax=Crocinitomix catalasitica TaxID=184607 RepID=UPI00048951E1|nr:T9SS type A sorting domain-containing protein [Crocinitomix catalasitica]